MAPKQSEFTTGEVRGGPSGGETRAAQHDLAVLVLVEHPLDEVVPAHPLPVPRRREALAPLRLLALLPPAITVIVECAVRRRRPRIWH